MDIFSMSYRGVLTLRLPKIAGERSRTIKVMPK
jgi:hypothetical protein